MDEVYKIIYDRIAALVGTVKVFFEYAPEIDPATSKAPKLPYVTYNMPYSTESWQREDLTLEVDVWDKTTDTTTIDQLVDTIDGDGSVSNASGLHRYLYYASGKPVLKIYRMNRLILPDPDPDIKRRQLRYMVKWFK